VTPKETSQRRVGISLFELSVTLAFPSVKNVTKYLLNMLILK
jgi:hypothetical protein